MQKMVQKLKLIKIYIAIIIMQLTLSSCSDYFKPPNGNYSYKTEKKAIDQYEILISDYKSELLMNNSTGKVYKISDSGEHIYVMIFWDNETKALGTMNEEYRKTGQWYVYDKMGRLRKSIFYNSNTGTLSSIKMFSRNGQLIYSGGSVTDF